MPLGWDAGKKAGGRGFHRRFSDQKPVVSNHHLQAQRKEVRGPVAPGGPTPESPLYSSSQSPDKGKISAAPPQKARLPEATEPPRREAALLHNVNNQISQDGEPRTDSWYVISSTRVAQGGSQDRSGAQQAQGLCRGHSKSHLLSASLIPEPREGRDQQTGGVTEQKVTCRE